MKNIIIGILIGILLNGLIVFAMEKVTINPLQDIISFIEPTQVHTKVKTTKVTTPEGTYRLFILCGGYHGGITAVRIK